MKFLTQCSPVAVLASLLALIALTPLFAFAQSGDLGDLTSIFDAVLTFINNVLVPLVFALAFLMFIWGVFQYFILGSDDEGKRETGRSFMLYGIIGFVVMVSIWGIVNILSTGLFGTGADQGDIQNVPNAPGTR